MCSEGPIYMSHNPSYEALGNVLHLKGIKIKTQLAASSEPSVQSCFLIL